MSARHNEALREIRTEYDLVVATLKVALGRKKRGSPGAPDYDPARLPEAIANANDAYALLMIATAEAFLREYLTTVGVAPGSEPKLSSLIDQAAKQLNAIAGYRRVRADDRQPIHDLRIMRNSYAHGHGRNVFPSVPRVEGVLATFLGPFS